MAFRVLVATFRRFSKASSMKALPAKTLFPQMMTVRSVGNLLPKSQYDTPNNKDKLSFPRVCYKYWETTPLFATTGVSLFVLVGAIIWAIRNKVDVVFTTHNRRNISRTMDLRNPTVHKMIVINQTYKPWPEMQASLDRIHEEECNRTLKANPAGH